MKTRDRLFRALARLAIGLIAAVGAEARADFFTFTDAGGFLTAAGDVTVESFEGSSGTNLTSLSTPNFLLTHTGSAFSVLDTPSPFGTFATDGVRYLEENTAGTNEFLFSGFAGPVTAFGLDVTDFGDFGALPLVLTINGTAQFTVAVPPHPDGSLLFFGVVATGPDQITDVRLRSGDAIGIDNVRLTAVPEPTTLFMLSTGAVVLLGNTRFRRPRIA